MSTFRILAVIAWRNLWRNPRRTMLTTATIAVGLSLLLVFFGLGDGSHGQMLRTAVQSGGAHVAVQAAGYEARRAIGLTLPAGVIERVKAALSGGRLQAAVVPRLFASGLASSSDGSSGVEVVGIDAALEARVSVLDDSLVAGRFLGERSPNAAVIGVSLARKLRLQPGSKFVLMTQGPASPEIQSGLLRVAGVVKSGADEIDQRLILVSLPTLQSMLGLAGRIHQAAVVLRDADDTAPAIRTLAHSLDGPVEVLGWEELMPSLRDFIRVDVAGLFIIDSMFFLIIAFMVMNTLLMSVLERGREFSLLDAVGLTPRRRFSLVMLEGTWVAAMATAGGTLAGVAGHWYFRTYGLHLESLMDGGFSAAGTAVAPVVYSVLSPGRAALAVTLVFLLTVALTLVPARRAATQGDVHLLGRQ